MKSVYKAMVFAGGLEIKLKAYVVNAKLNLAQSRLSQLELPQPTQSTGRNSLKYTKEWKEREEMIHQFLNQYIEAVDKNLRDTIENIRKLKEQDEALGR